MTELYEYMGKHLTEDEIAYRKAQFCNRRASRPVKSLPEVLREIGEALGAWP